MLLACSGGTAVQQRGIHEAKDLRQSLHVALMVIQISCACSLKRWQCSHMSELEAAISQLSHTNVCKQFCAGHVVVLQVHCAC